MARGDNSEGNPYRYCQQHGDANKPNVFERLLHNLTLMSNKEINEVHSSSRLLRTSGNLRRMPRPQVPLRRETLWPKKSPLISPRRAMRCAWPTTKTRQRRE